MDHKRLRQRCEMRLRELELPAPFDLRAFCERLERRRRRPIVLRPIATGSECYGLWVATSAADIIFYERATTPLHRDHIVLHELCHLLCGHQPAAIADPAVARELFPDVEPGTVRSLLQRSGYSTDEEREAELLASLILERAAGSASGPPAALDAQTAAVLGQLEATLEEGPA